MAVVDTFRIVGVKLIRLSQLNTAHAGISVCLIGLFNNYKLQRILSGVSFNPVLFY